MHDRELAYPLASVTFCLVYKIIKVVLVMSTNN